ncbi:MAG: ArsR family transcriptional regulator [Propionibacteriales bacterium]|nr:ArsR family transcriptional regulator [Propionibacteriales bacterium]
MISLRMSVDGLGRTRFACSPLAEVACSLHMLSTRRLQPLHRGWLPSARAALRQVDTELLAAVVPPHHHLADFLFVGAHDPSTTIEQQLGLLTTLPTEELRRDLTTVWGDKPIPAVLERLLADGPAGAERLADTLLEYWSLAIEPHWRRIRSVLDDDVAYRAGRLTSLGVSGLLSDLHPEVSIDGDILHIDKPQHTAEADLGGEGLLLVPSVFVWPHLLVSEATSNHAGLTYAARAVGTLWEQDAQEDTDEDTLGALLGRSRAAIVRRLELPLSTTELATELHQSAPAVSQHLSVLKRAGLVSSWRSGRSVLYQRTPLATSVAAAAGRGGAGSSRDLA